MGMLRRKLSYANVVSSLALFVALAGGTAWAVDEWTGANIQDGTLTGADVEDDSLGSRDVTSIQSQDVRDDHLTGGGLASQDLATDSVGRSELSESAFAPSDISRDSSTAAFEVADNAIQSGEVSPGTLTAQDVATNALTGVNIDEPSLSGFDGHDDYLDRCDTPEDNSFRDCVSVTFTLGGPMKVLATLGGGASHGSYTSDNTTAYGECQVRLDGANKLAPIAMNSSGTSNIGMPTISDVMSLSAGSHTIALACRENPSDLEFEDLTIAVVELGFD